MNPGIFQNEETPDPALEETAEELYEMAPCGYLTTTVEGRIVKVNRTLTEWLGYERDELTTGKSFVNLLTVGGRIFFETHLNLLLRLKTNVDEIALDLIRKDGSILPALMNARQKRNADGDPVANRFTIFNASERRMYERELLAARDLFRTTLSSIGDGVVATDSQGRITFLNPIAEQLSGWADDAAHGRPIEEVLQLCREDDSATVGNPIRQALRDGVITGMADHTMLISRDGRRIPVEDSASPIRDAAGVVIGGVLVFRDISQRRQAEALERARQERYRESLRLDSLGLMAGGIAHDFNNLLTGILGNASLLADSVDPGDVHLVDEIVAASERAALLTKQMLAYSGKDWLELARFDLNARVRERLATIKSALGPNIRLQLELAPAACMIEADPAQVEQVVVNLLMNASEALGPAGGTIVVRTGIVEQRPFQFSVHMRSGVAAGSYAILEVRDTGSGMTPEVLRKAFDPFFTTKFTGRGLGLSAVLGIVRAHHGDIEVDSEPGVGSVFRIFLPAVG